MHLELSAFSATCIQFGINKTVMKNKLFWVKNHFYFKIVNFDSAMISFCCIFKPILDNDSDVFS